MKLTIHEVKSLVALLHEAGEKKKKPTKVKGPEDVDDVFPKPSVGAPMDRSEKTDPEKVDEPQAPPRRKAPRIEDVLTSPVNVEPRDAPYFDFDDAFERALEMGGTLRDIERENLDAPPQSKMLPTGAIARQQSASISSEHRPMPYSLVKAEAESILMDEFFVPAAAVGQRILGSVWTEIRRLAHEHPDVFDDQFAAALQSIRDIEDAWFSGLLGFAPVPSSLPSPSGSEEREVLDRLMHVLNRYYRTVLEASRQNAGSLLMRMDQLRNSVGETEFKRAFKDALTRTRDLEDQAFLHLMGGPRRMR